MMQKARGGHVAFLTQDAVPAGRGWLAQLLRGFAAAPDVGLVFGPYLPRADASPEVARELSAWFDSFTNGSGQPRVDALAPDAAGSAGAAFLGHVGFFTDANGCVARSAWERVPFRPVAYAEDHLLAQDMLRAGFAKVYVPERGRDPLARVLAVGVAAAQLRRGSRGASRSTGSCPAPVLTEALRAIRGGVGADRRWLLDERAGALRRGGSCRSLLAGLDDPPPRARRGNRCSAPMPTGCRRHSSAKLSLEGAVNGDERGLRHLRDGPAGASATLAACQLQPSAASGCRWWSARRSRKTFTVPEERGPHAQGAGAASRAGVSPRRRSRR